MQDHQDHPQALNRDLLSSFTAFCQRQGIDTSLNRTFHQWGKLVFEGGEVYTFQEEYHEAYEVSQCRLKPVARFDGKYFSPVDDNDQERLASMASSELEYIALNTHKYPLLNNHFWDGWNPLQRNDGHQDIYQHILRVLEMYGKKGSSILVVGCGEGAFLDLLTERGYEAMGIERNGQNVEIALSTGKKVQREALEELPSYGSNGMERDIIFDPGVLSAGVVERSSVERALLRIAERIRTGGYFIHAPFAPSLLCADDLRKHGFAVKAMSVPSNLFTGKLPKQFYVGQKV